jgi:hypothetical protein
MISLAGWFRRSDDAQSLNAWLLEEVGKGRKIE